MKKKISLMIISSMLLLSGCHSHEFEEANCIFPKTCIVCGLTEGEAKGHKWADATCDSPKTCLNCNKTDGEAYGHTTQYGKCSRCSEMQGNEIREKLDTYKSKLLDCQIDYMSVFHEANKHIDMKKGTDDWDGFVKEMRKSESAMAYVNEIVSDICEISADINELSDIRNKAKQIADIGIITINSSGSNATTYISNADKIINALQELDKLL